MTRPVLRQFPLAHEATAIAIAADGKRMAAAAATMGRVVIYDLRAGRVLFRFGVTATAVAFLPDGVRLVTAWAEPRRPPPSRRGADVPSSSPTSSSPNSSSPTSDVPSTESSRGAPASRDAARDSTRDSSRDSTRSIEDDARRSVRVWDLITGRCTTPEPWFGEAPIAVSPDGLWIAAAADRITTAVLLMHASDGRIERMLQLSNSRPLRSLSFSTDGKWLFASTGAAPVIAWSMDDFSARLPEGARTTDVALASSSTGLFFAAEEDCTVRVYAPAVSDIFIKLGIRRGQTVLRGIDALWLSPDESLVIARGRTGTTQFFSRVTGRPLWTASAGPLAFLPDGKTLAAWWCGAIWMREAETGDLIVPSPDESPAVENTQDSPQSRRITLRSGEPDGQVTSVLRVKPPLAPIVSDEPEPASVEAAAALITRLSTGWSGTTYRQPPAQMARDPDGLGVRLPLRGGFAYVQIRPRKDTSRLLVQVNADEPDIDPPPSSSLVRLSRWIRERWGGESRRQAIADREFAAELAPHAAEGDVRIERAPGVITIVLERSVLPTVDDIELLVHKAEQKLAS